LQGKKLITSTPQYQIKNSVRTIHGTNIQQSAKQVAHTHNTEVPEQKFEFPAQWTAWLQIPKICGVGVRQAP
jgi:hypothetical protein